MILFTSVTAVPRISFWNLYTPAPLLLAKVSNPVVILHFPSLKICTFTKGLHKWMKKKKKKTHQFSSVTQLCPTLCDPMDCRMPGIPVHHQLPEFTPTHVHWVGNGIQQSHPLLPLLLLPSIFPSIRVFSNESVLLIKWPKYWSFNFSISPSNEYSGLISFRMDWLDLLAVQGTLKSLLQHHSSKAAILWHLPSSWSNSHIHTWLLEKL